MCQSRPTLSIEKEHKDLWRIKFLCYTSLLTQLNMILVNIITASLLIWRVVFWIAFTHVPKTEMEHKDLFKENAWLWIIWRSELIRMNNIIMNNNNNLNILRNQGKSTTISILFTQVFSPTLHICACSIKYAISYLNLYLIQNKALIKVQLKVFLLP